jgi:protein-S-isoprenylcysteine O-methyltransferase Ste14
LPTLRLPWGESMSDGRTPADTPGVIAPPPLIALAALLLGVAGDWLWPVDGLARVLNWPVRIGLGGALLVGGGVLVVAGEQAFKRVGTNVPPWEPALALATTGVYAHFRNPMYVGGMLMLAGLAIALASDWLAILLLPTALLLHFGVVRREERYLEAKFGEDYRRYKASVPRYGWPR